MGTDIHMHVEYKFDNPDKWFCGDYFRLNPYSRSFRPDYELVEFFDVRNYSLFAVLANVRNYGDTKYIDDPRGMPENASDIVKSDYSQWLGDNYGCSYFTLQELIDFHNQGHPLKRRGKISPKAQKNLDLGILPDMWCQYTGQPDWELREWEEENNVLVPLIEKLKERADELDLIWKFYWDSEHIESRNLAYEKSANIRIVFWFDN